MIPSLTTSPGLAIAVIIALGVTAQWIAWRIRIPAILPLLTIGFLIGPALGLLRPSDFIDNELLFPVVSLAVGLILFEGGLTLRLPQVKDVRIIVRNLVSIGALVTWLGATVAAILLMGLDVPLAFLFGALIIVTGPTVIGPLLRNVRPQARLTNILKWEGILIDPIGALVAVLVFEFLLLDNRSAALGQTVGLFLQVILVGSLLGLIGGLSLSLILRRHLVPDYLANVVSLSLVFAVFGLANTLAPEAGLLATTMMGIIVANRRVPHMNEILSFKEALSILLISMLFIVLAANIELDTFLEALSWRSLGLVLVIMLLVRPANVFVSSIGSPLTIREKLFLSWIAPRGIVAASVASLFAFELVHGGYEGAAVIEPLVFLVILGTVVLNSVTAKPLARLLKVAEPDPQGFLILGAHPFARSIAALLQKEGLQVLLGDTNWSNVAAARVEGLSAYYGSLLSDHSDDEIRLSGLGRLLALTSNDEANALTALKYARDFGSENVYQLAPARSDSARAQLGMDQSGRILFRKGTTYRTLERLFARGAKLKKTDITEQFGLADFDALYGDDYLPLFVVSGRRLRVLTEASPPPEAGTTLISLVIEPVAESVRS